MIKINNTRKYILIDTPNDLFAVKFSTTVHRDGEVHYHATGLKKIVGIDPTSMKDCPQEIAKKIVTSLTNLSLELIKSTGAIPSKQ